MRSGAACFTLLLGITACVPQPFTTIPRIPSTSATPMTMPVLHGPADVLIIADTHASNPFTHHDSVSESWFGDYVATHVAIRPPQMDMWGPTILRNALAQNSDVAFILHLGDAANVACRSEMQRFVAVMRSQSPPWVMAPGNHDSLMMGNWSEDSFQGSAWIGSCTGAMFEDDHMNKNLFMRGYATAQGWELPAPTPYNDGDRTWCLDLDRAELPSKSPIERVRLCEDVVAPNHSYLLQQVSLAPGLMLIVVDTTAYPVSQQAPVVSSGGSKGSLGDAQLAVLRGWLEDNHRAGQPRTVILAGHFPLEFLDGNSRDALSALIAAYPIATYLSAHTHDPSTALYHTASKGSDAKFVEINFGSLLDWPMELSRAVFTADTASASMTLSVTDVATTNTCEPTWKSPDYIQDSKPSAVYTAYVDRSRYRKALWFLGNRAYAREQRAMYTQLEKALAITIDPDHLLRESTEDRTTQDHFLNVKLDNYEWCQARWASEAEGGTRHGMFGGPTKWKNPHPVRLRDNGTSVGTWRWSWNLVRPTSSAAVSPVGNIAR